MADAPSGLRAHAHRHAAAGRRVFTLKSGLKLPAIDDFPNRATTDPTTIDSLWFDDIMELEHPLNIGISTDGLLAIDVDNKDGRDGNGSLMALEMLVDLPETYEQFTPSGGRHLVFSSPVPISNSVQKIGSGLDVRGRGGFIVASGSVVEKGTYTDNGKPIVPAPQALIDLCGVSTERALNRETPVDIDKEQATKRFSDYLLNHAPRSVKGDGGDATAYQVACRGRDYGLSEGATLDAMLSESWDNGCGWSPERLAEKVSHAFAYAKGAAGNLAPETEFQPIELPELPAQAPPVQIKDSKGKDLPQSAVLIGIGERARLVCDPDGDAFAVIDVRGHQETHRVRGSEFSDYLAGEYHRLTKRGANRNALADAVTTLAAQAKARGEIERVWLRTSAKDGCIYLDDGTPERGCYEIACDGWRHLAVSPVLFQRTRKMTAYPAPTVPDFALLAKYVNVMEDGLVLVAAFILGALRPRGPYPPLGLHGEQGSAKSSSSRRIKALTDPSTAPLRSLPKDGIDLLVAAASSWVLALDNASGISPQLSDDLCRLSTGGSLAKRALYSDAEEVQIELTRPVIFNGIDDGATRADLADRTMHVEAPRILVRRSESDLDAEFAKDAGAIFAAVLDGLSLALRCSDNIDIGELPRMADFAKWAAAGMPALGFTAEQFLAAYRRNQLHAVAAGLDTSALARAVQEFADAMPQWRGTSTELLQHLNVRATEHERRAPSWPRSPKGLQNALRRLGPSLRHVGIEFHQGREAEGRFLSLQIDQRVRG